MKIEIDKIPDGGLDLMVDEPASLYDIEDKSAKFISPVSISVHADFIAKQLIVRGRIKTGVLFCCSRCLKEFVNDIAIDDYTYDCEASRGDIIDLTENIREYIIIDLPMRPLCAEGCKGLCPVCGKDLNAYSCDCSRKKMDPRFGDLDKLKFD